jgi:hypothetical protein
MILAWRDVAEMLGHFLWPRAIAANALLHPNNLYDAGQNSINQVSGFMRYFLYTRIEAADHLSVFGIQCGFLGFNICHDGSPIS